MSLDVNQVLLYAATEPDYQMALGAAAMSGVPHSRVTGNFVDAWNAVASGSQLVMAVGGAALYGLYYNPCGWKNPANHPGGHTPFILINNLTDTLPGANYFVNVAGTNAEDTLRRSGAFTYYAVTGKLPNVFQNYPGPMHPVEACVGSDNVPCPILKTPAGIPSGSSGGSGGGSTGSGGSGIRTQPYWGVDSAAQVSSSFYDCVVRQYGKPDFWGRYLTRVSGVNDGLTTSEIGFLHSNGVKILPIYNGFSQATGYSNGQQVGQMAVTAAKGLGMPNGVPIFADVEVMYAVDAQWVRGYVETLLTSPYAPGIYANPTNGSFNQAYCTAVSENSSIKNTLIWSNEPEPGVGAKVSAPSWNASSPSCTSTVVLWQYGENGSACSAGIDTDLAQPSLYNQLW